MVQPQLDGIVVDAQATHESVGARQHLDERGGERRLEVREMDHQAVSRSRELQRGRRKHLALSERRAGFGVEAEGGLVPARA
jgi:hypothetical protein